MRITSRIGMPTVEWAQSGYPNDLVPSSPEHSGAHARLLELAVEMESDFEPWANVAAMARITPTATADVGILLSSTDRLGQIGASA